MKYRLSPRAQAIFHRIPLLSSQYSYNISPRVQCGKTAGKTRINVTQFNSKLHCRDFVRMAPPQMPQPGPVRPGGPGGPDGVM